MQITVVSCCELCPCGSMTRADAGGRGFGKRRVNTRILQGHPKLRFSLLLLRISFMLTDRIFRTPGIMRECFWGKKKNLNYRLLEQLPVRISSIQCFQVEVVNQGAFYLDC